MSSRSERAGRRRKAEALVDAMRLNAARRQAEAYRDGLSSLRSDHMIVDFKWVSPDPVPARFDSIEAVERFLNG